MSEDAVFDMMAECFADAATIINEFNKHADTAQKVTHQGQHVPQLAAMMFQARLQMPPPDEDDGGTFQ